MIRYELGAISIFILLIFLGLFFRKISKKNPDEIDYSCLDE